ncbi:Hypothetical protein FKW44_012451, partial [Caligus rogercresseyi]
PFMRKNARNWEKPRRFRSEKSPERETKFELQRVEETTPIPGTRINIKWSFEPDHEDNVLRIRQ